MNRRHVLALAFTTWVAGSMPAVANEPVPAAPLDADPEHLVRNLYDRYGGTGADYLANKKERERYFSAGTAALVAKALAKGEKAQEPAIDYDPLIDGQDGEVKDLTVAVKSQNAAKATVVASFNSFGKKTNVTFDLVNEKSVWRVDDIRGGHDSSLKKIARDYLK